MFTRTRSSTSPAPRRRSARPLVVAALCAALVAAAPAPAQAQAVDDPDADGDMAMLTFTDNGEAFVPAPERTLNDVSNTTLAHRTHRVAVRVDYVELKRKAGGRYQSLWIVMKTDEGARRFVELDVTRRHWSGETSMFTGRGRTVRCAVRHSIDYEANVIRLSFPRRCASNPRWVTFRVGASGWTGNDVFIDDALRDRPLTTKDSKLARSDRVRLGAAS